MDRPDHSLVDVDIRALLAKNVHQARSRRGLTLIGLAETSGVGKATLSGVENSSGNPTIETVWRLAKALNVSFGQLIDQPDVNHVIREGGVSAKLIDRQTEPQVVETYLMDLLPNVVRHADAHMAGVMEHVTVLRGSLMIGSEEQPVRLHIGKAYSFQADCPHVYRGLEEGARVMISVVYPPVSQQLRTGFDLRRPWPKNADEWAGLELQFSRIRLEIQQGLHACRLVFDGCDLPPGEADAMLRRRLLAHDRFHGPAQAFAVHEQVPTIVVFPRFGNHLLLPEENGGEPPISKALALANRAASTWRAPDKAEINRLRATARGKVTVLAALAAEALTMHGMPAVPACIERKVVAPLQETGQDEVLFEDRIDVDAYAAYELVHPAYAKQCVAIATHLAPIARTGRFNLLDIGTGPGLPLEMLLELLPGLHVTAVDPSETAFHYLSRRFRQNARVKPVKASITGLPPARPRFDAAISVGASHHLNTSHFLQSAHRQLKPGALFIVADEMISPFDNRTERQINLIVHHLQYVADTMVDVPSSGLTKNEISLVELIRRNVPAAIFLARAGLHAAAGDRCRMLLDQIRALALPEPVSHALLAFYRFHHLELEALVAGLDYEVEQKTFPACFADLAAHAGFALCAHQRLYATDGRSEWHAGTHLFVLRALP